MILLDIRNLNIDIETPNGVFRAVEDFNFSLHQGEIHALIGESGSGRSLIAKAILGIAQENVLVRADRIFFYNAQYNTPQHSYFDLMDLSLHERQHIMCHDIAMIFQNPMSCLDPSLTIGQQLLELIPNISLKRSTRKKNIDGELSAINILHRAGIRNHQQILESYPFELSEGICKKIMIAMSIAMKPRLLIADEPTSTMDTSTQAQVLRMLDKMNQMHGMSILLISNELSAIARFAHSFSFIYSGQLVETGTREEIFNNPQHPYTHALLKAIPGFQELRLPKSDLYTLPGLLPTLEHPPLGCRLGPRCPNAQRRCIQMPPTTYHKTHSYRCHYPMTSTQKNDENS